MDDDDPYVDKDRNSLFVSYATQLLSPKEVQIGADFIELTNPYVKIPDYTNTEGKTISNE